MNSFSFFPVELEFLKNFSFAIGGEFGFLINDKSSGKHTSWALGTTGFSENINEDFVRINQKINFGFISRLAYKVKLREGLFIVPEILGYLGVSQEFSHQGSEPKSKRLFLGIGLSKNLK